MVKKMISWTGALCALAGSAYAASATVWSAADGNGTVPPVNGWYSYPDAKATAAEAAGAKATLTTATDKSKVLALSVSKTNEKSAAGMGFAWAKSNGVISLEDYAGVCLTYSAEVPFRLEFKQSTIKDYDFYGAMVPAATKLTTTFIAFADLEQEGWGTEKALDLTKQQALQFGYKQAFVADYGTTNTITVSAVWLGSNCEQHAPELGAGYAAGDEVILNEGDTLHLDLTKVFVDADEDELTYAVEIEDAKLVLLADTLYKKTKVLNLMTKSNPVGSTAVTITATDPTKKSVAYEFSIETVDRENAPVAVNDTYTVKEETKLAKSTVITGVMANDYDPDGDAFTAELVEPTAHGTLTFDGKTGGFTYTPEKDFFGEDVFTYQLVESKEDNPKTSDVGTVTIKVTNVDDPLTVVIADSTLTLGEDSYKLGDTLVVAEDFDPVSVMIPLANLQFVDPDVAAGETVPVKVKSSGVVKVAYAEFGTDHVIDLESIKDANGVAKVTVFAVDGKDTASVFFYVKVTPVADPPIAVADAYEVMQDTVNEITAKKGVLANDKNPDNAKSLLTAVLVEDGTYGTVKLAEDGSFTYAAPEEEGEDTFVYVVVNAEGDTSEPVIVNLTIVYKNKAPSIVKGVADTVGNRLADLTEDFNGSKKYTKAEMQSWFTDDSTKSSALTFKVRSDDSLLAPVISGGSLLITSVTNACGDAKVILIASDTQGASTELAIPAKIACTDDKPMARKNVDTLYVGAKEVLLDTVDLSAYLYDPDGDSLTFSVTSNLSIEKKLEWEIKGNLLVVKTKENVKLEAGTVLALSIWAHDATDSATCVLRLITSPDPTSIKPMLASPKASWQNAILADRGTAAMIDLQGRVMWKAKLPVSEADVRNAAAQVQGRKILQVNKQRWTIK